MSSDTHLYSAGVWFYIFKRRWQDTDPQTIPSVDGCVFTEKYGFFLGWTGGRFLAVLASLWDCMDVFGPGCWAQLGHRAPGSRHLSGTSLMPQLVINEWSMPWSGAMWLWWRVIPVTDNGLGTSAQWQTPQNYLQVRNCILNINVFFQNFVLFCILIKQKKPNRFFPLLILIKLASRLQHSMPKFNLEMLAASSLEQRQQWCCNYQLIFCLNTTQRVSWIQTG